MRLSFQECIRCLRKKDKELTSIVLEIGSTISDEDARQLASFLSKNETVTVLDISFCGLSEEGVKIIAGSLVGNRTLKWLGFRGNKINSAGIRSLFPLLESKDSCLGFVDLRQNLFGDEDAINLHRIVSQNSKLKMVLIENTAFGKDGEMEKRELDRISLLRSIAAFPDNPELYKNYHGMLARRLVKNLLYHLLSPDNIPEISEFFIINGVIGFLLQYMLIREFSQHDADGKTALHLLFEVANKVESNEKRELIIDTIFRFFYSRMGSMKFLLSQGGHSDRFYESLTNDREVVDFFENLYVLGDERYQGSYFFSAICSPDNFSEDDTQLMEHCEQLVRNARELLRRNALYNDQILLMTYQVLQEKNIRKECKVGLLLPLFEEYLDTVGGRRIFSIDIENILNTSREFWRCFKAIIFIRAMNQKRYDEVLALLREDSNYFKRVLVLNKSDIFLLLIVAELLLLENPSPEVLEIIQLMVNDTWILDGIDGTTGQSGADKRTQIEENIFTLCRAIMKAPDIFQRRLGIRNRRWGVICLDEKSWLGALIYYAAKKYYELKQQGADLSLLTVISDAIGLLLDMGANPGYCQSRNRGWVSDRDNSVLHYLLLSDAPWPLVDRIAIANAKAFNFLNENNETPIDLLERRYFSDEISDKEARKLQLPWVSSDLAEVVVYQQKRYYMLPELRFCYGILRFIANEGEGVAISWFEDQLGRYSLILVSSDGQYFSEASIKILSYLIENSNTTFFARFLNFIFEKYPSVDISILLQLIASKLPAEVESRKKYHDIIFRALFNKILISATEAEKRCCWSQVKILLEESKEALSESLFEQLFSVKLPLDIVLIILECDEAVFFKERLLELNSPMANLLEHYDVNDIKDLVEIFKKISDNFFRDYLFLSEKIGNLYVAVVDGLVRAYLAADVKGQNDSAEHCNQLLTLRKVYPFPHVSDQFRTQFIRNVAELCPYNSQLATRIVLRVIRDDLIPSYFRGKERKGVKLPTGNNIFPTYVESYVSSNEQSVLCKQKNVVVAHTVFEILSVCPLEDQSINNAVCHCVLLYLNQLFADTMNRGGGSLLAKLNRTVLGPITKQIFKLKCPMNASESELEEVVSHIKEIEERNVREQLRIEGVTEEADIVRHDYWVELHGGHIGRKKIVGRFVELDGIVRVLMQSKMAYLLPRSLSRRSGPLFLEEQNAAVFDSIGNSGDRTCPYTI